MLHSDIYKPCITKCVSDAAQSWWHHGDDVAQAALQLS